MTDRIISLYVGTDDDEGWRQIFQDFSELAHSIGERYHYVGVSSTFAGVDDSEPECDPQGLYYDENTIVKVREAIKEAVETRVATAPESLITDIITEIQNAGILFRESR
jgi:hypothetical protein